METFLFWIFAIVGVGCGFMVVFHRNPMSSAIYLVVTMLCLAGFYALLAGAFVAVIQVLVYAGAVMVLMLFVIMMLNLREETLQREGSILTWIIAGRHWPGTGGGSGATVSTHADWPPTAGVWHHRRGR